jgi:hypothetical protein
MMTQRSFLKSLAPLIPVVLMVVLMIPLADGFTDDGFIHIQYARNIIERGEYSFNPGEVSFGTSSPLWVMELAAIGRFFSDREALIMISRVLSWLAGLAALLFLFRLTRKLEASVSIALMAALTFAADPWFLRWTALSMETSMAVLAVVLMGLAAPNALKNRRDAAALGVAIALASMVRPEVYFALPVVVIVALTRWNDCDRRAVLTTLICASVLLLPWWLFAKIHIGSFLPNTAGAKSGGLVMNPISWLQRFTPIMKILGSAQAPLLVGALLSVAVMRGKSILWDARCRFLLIWAVGLPIAYVVLGIQILSRYLLLVSPITCVLCWLAIDQLARHLITASRIRTAAVAVVCGMTIIATSIFYFLVVVPPSQEFTYDLTHEMKQIAVYLDEHADEDAVVAAADIGYLSFYSNRRVLDLGGLVEPETGMLREKYDYEVIVDEGLYFDVPGYPHVDYFIDRVLVPSRFDGKILAGHRFREVHAVVVRNLGIRKPGPYYYTLYELTPVSDE